MLRVKQMLDQKKILIIRGSGLLGADINCKLYNN
jgi:hypothetical protein